jgi:hypothetical protein
MSPLAACQQSLAVRLQHKADQVCPRANMPGADPVLEGKPLHSCSGLHSVSGDHLGCLPAASSSDQQMLVHQRNSCDDA